MKWCTVRYYGGWCRQFQCKYATAVFFPAHRWLLLWHTRILTVLFVRVVKFCLWLCVGSLCLLTSASNFLCSVLLFCIILVYCMAGNFGHHKISPLGVQNHFFGNLNLPFCCYHLLIPVCRQKFSTEFNLSIQASSESSENIIPVTISCYTVSDIPMRGKKTSTHSHGSVLCGFKVYLSVCLYVCASSWPSTVTLSSSSCLTTPSKYFFCSHF